MPIPEEVADIRGMIWKPSGSGILAVGGVSLRAIVAGAGE
jgi:hypothetical protein